MKHGWKKYISAWLILIMIGFALSYASGIVGLYAGSYTANAINLISSLLIGAYFIRETFVLAESANKIQKNFSSDNLEIIEKESGSFSYVTGLKAANITSNVCGILSTTARLLPVLQPDQNGKYEDGQKTALSILTAIYGATILGNFAYLTIFSNRNHELSEKMPSNDSAEEVEQGVIQKKIRFEK